jgi:hypothetical protein
MSRNNNRLNIGDTPYPFEPGQTGFNLAVSTTSSGVAIGNAGSQILITNYGTVAAFVAFGVTSATATTANLCVLPGAQAVYTRPVIGSPENAAPVEYIAAITASGTTNLQIHPGWGI